MRDIREEEMCPAYYMQNNGDKDRYEFEAIACKEVGWVVHFLLVKIGVVNRNVGKNIMSLRME